MRHWAQTAEHLAYFFSQDFFVPRSFGVLNAETEPEYCGFRQCAIALFQHYKKEESLPTTTTTASTSTSVVPDPEEEFYQYCYQDDYCTQLDLDSVSRFLSWAGILKPIGEYSTLAREGHTIYMGQAEAEAASAESWLRSCLERNTHMRPAARAALASSPGQGYHGVCHAAPAPAAGRPAAGAQVD